jgi:hypothetical protein
MSIEIFLKRHPSVIARLDRIRTRRPRIHRQTQCAARASGIANYVIRRFGVEAGPVSSY